MRKLRQAEKIGFVSSSPRPKLWLAGLPCVGERRLSEQESAALQGRKTTSRLGCLALGCSVPIALFVMMAFFTTLSEGLSPDSFWFMPIVTLIIAVPATLFLKANDMWGRARQLGRLQRESRVLIFQGDKHQISEIFLTQLLQYLDLSTRTVTIEALPCGEVLVVNARQPHSELKIATTKTEPSLAASPRSRRALAR